MATSCKNQKSNDPANGCAGAVGDVPQREPEKSKEDGRPTTALEEEEPPPPDGGGMHRRRHRGHSSVADGVHQDPTAAPIQGQGGAAPLQRDDRRPDLHGPNYRFPLALPRPGPDADRVYTEGRNPVRSQCPHQGQFAR